jgi:predicted nucleic acid-binding protein
MSLVLIDTNIASFIFKGSAYAKPYEALLNGQELALSFMSIAELLWLFREFASHFDFKVTFTGGFC